MLVVTDGSADDSHVMILEFLVQNLIRQMMRRRRQYQGLRIDIEGQFALDLDSCTLGRVHDFLGDDLR